MRFIATLAFCWACLAALGAEPKPKPKEYYDPDVQKLIAVEWFAWGEIGLAKERSAGEKAFAAILKKEQAIRYLLTAFDHGTPEARCYVLVALREMSDALYDACDEAFRSDPPRTIYVVTRGDGRFETPAKVNADIARGVYRKHFVEHEGG